MSNTVAVVVDVKTLGMKDAVKDSAAFNNNLKGAEATARKMSKVYANSSANPNYQSGQGETKTSRSIGGASGTGSAASDFAAQAQGLGGLVHLYATFAANLFAVGAAWSALSKAMDVTNLVKGLDQIGAATGRNLGSLAKQMVSVADGAISMQQAMTSTAMASSGGMTNVQILRMTQVAKNASLALGRDLPDSMERLTKGIVKTQPELLDELGIMTRVIPAQQKYAESIGKTVGSLTEFEKRQAFANAVLSEGESKFSAINMDANPYTKLLSSIQNLMQSGLELVNKVLGPMLTMLASSPTGLATVLAGIGTMLLKQAIPALGMFKENAKRAAQEAYDFAQRRQQDAEDASIARDTRAMESAKKKFVGSPEGIAAAHEVNKVRFNSKAAGAELTSIMRKDAATYSASDLATLREGRAALEKLDKDNLTTMEANLKKSLDKKISAYLAYDRTVGKIEEDAADASHARTSSRLVDQENLNNRILEKHKARMNSTEVVSNAVDTTSTRGLREGFGTMMNDIREKDMKGWNKWSTVAKGSIGIVTQKLSSIVSAFSVYGQVVALVGVALGVLDGWLTKNAKETAAYNTALDALNSSFGNIDRTLEVISKKDPLGQISVESVQARANAFIDLTDNINSMVAAFSKVAAARSGWDSFKNGFFDMFGAGDGDKLAKGLSTSVVEALKIMEEGDAKEAAKTALSDLLGGKGTKINLESIEAINASIKDLDEAEIAKKGKAIEKLLSKAALEANNGAAALTSFKVALADISKQALLVSNKLMPTDDFSKMGVELGKAGKTLSDSTKDTMHYLTALREIAKNTAALSFIDPKEAARLVSSVKEIEDLSIKLVEQEKGITTARQSAQEALNIASNPNFNDIQAVEAAKQKFKLEQASINIKEADRDETKKSLASIKSTFESIPGLLAKASFDNLTKGLQNAVAAANLSMQKGFVGIAAQSGANMDVANAELTLKDLGLKAELIKQEVAMVAAIAALNATTALNTVVSERKNILLETSIAQTELDNAKASGDRGGTRAIREKLGSLERRLSENTDKLPEATKREALTRSVTSAKGGISNVNLQSEEFAKLVPELHSAIMGAKGKLAGVAGEREVAKVALDAAKANEPIKAAKVINSLELERLKNSKKVLDSQKTSSEYYNQTLETAKLENTQNTIALEYGTKQLDILEKLTYAEKSREAIKGHGKSTTSIDANIAALNKQLETNAAGVAIDLQLASSAEEKARATYDLNKAYIESNHQIELANINSSAQADADALILQNKQDLSALTESEIALNAKLAADRKIDREYDITTLGIIKKYTQDIKKLQIDAREGKDISGPIGVLADQVARDIAIAKAKADAAKTGTSAAFTAASDTILAKADWTKGAQKGLQEYLDKVGDVASQSKDLMSKSFEGMTDALQEFVMTGKLDFNSLANSIIADMVRMAIQQSITGPLARMGMSLIANIIGGPAAGAGSMAGGTPMAGTPSLGYVGAKGGAFSGGVEKFAKGGSFTNSIVSNPTLFKFAHGTGLMGEAGPEAIMPLKRDSQGNLGVRTGVSQPQTNVTINIVESKEKAGTQERTNNNGVDMITVFVEKVKSSIASDINQGKGSVTGALKRTYGLNRVIGAN